MYIIILYFGIKYLLVLSKHLRHNLYNIASEFSVGF